VDWQLEESGPDDAHRRVLLLPGGLMSAHSWADVMAEPALKDLRLIAATLPGHCGTPPLADLSIENYGRLAADLARQKGCDVIVGSSMGATVALETVVTGAFTGPTVLVSISLSAADEPAFFHAIVRLGSILGWLPAAALIGLTMLLLRMASVSRERKAELTADFGRNDPRVIRNVFREYRRYLRWRASAVARLCDANVAAWVVHAERGDGRLTRDERAALEACPRAMVITLPGTSYLPANERPRPIAETIVAALAAV